MSNKLQKQMKRNNINRINIDDEAKELKKQYNQCNLLSEKNKFPISVQTFPIIADFTYENEKKQLANLAEPFFKNYEENFIHKFKNVSDIIVKKNMKFFKLISCAKQSNNFNKKFIKEALNELLNCSPKKILAEFHRYSLEAGWDYVAGYNKFIDELAEFYPRCRTKIYDNRLNYSDVIQISEEILTTLRVCSTLLEDIQRRYEILENLQNYIEADIEYTIGEKIEIAIKDAFKDNQKYGKDFWRTVVSFIMQAGTIVNGVSAPIMLPIEEQLKRADRIMVFFSTIEMFKQGWEEWQEKVQDVIEPNLRIMFELKRDFFKNQMIFICDTITYNGYKLDKLSAFMEKKFIKI